MNCDKVITVGEGPFVEIALDTYYLANGQVFEKKGDTPEGAEVEGRAKVGIQLTIPEMSDEIKAAAIAHSFKRKAQESASAEQRKETPDYQAWAEGFADVYGKLILGEREKAGGGSKVDSTETLAIKMVANVLKQKMAAGKLAEAKVAVPNLDSPPKTEKGHVNYIAWAKQLKAMEPEAHPWYQTALKKVSAEKGFE